MAEPVTTGFAPSSTLIFDPGHRMNKRDRRRLGLDHGRRRLVIFTESPTVPYPRD
jgi:hypothetical protein